MFILISAIFAWAMIASCIVFVILALTTRGAPDMVCYQKAEKDREKPFKCPYDTESCDYVDPTTSTLDIDCKDCERYIKPKTDETF